MPASRNESLTIGQCATLACLLEVSAPKPGNVHRGADFDDVKFEDFATAAVAIAPAMERAATQPVGQTVLQAIRATRLYVETNCNLGMVLLFAPLAAVRRDESLQTGVKAVLSELDAKDAADVYEAIRLSRAGGLGQVDKMDVSQVAPPQLLDAMQLASDRDLVARQYVTGFHTVFKIVTPWLLEAIHEQWSLAEAIVFTHVRLMAAEPDSLIARKCGPDVAKQSSTLAKLVLDSGKPGDDSYHESLADLDFWLRCDGRRRNPGTTADLIAAGIFALLRDGRILPVASSQTEENQ